MESITHFFTELGSNPIVVQSIDALIKMTLTVICSGFIGSERQHTHRPAGLRTHILVAVGSTLVMMTSSFIFKEYEGLTTVDPTRLGAQVISGIGFLGAGTIIREGFSVKGLTTAASLWAVSCIGLAIGGGYYTGALISTLVIYLTLNTFKRYFINKHPSKNIFIEVENLSQQPTEITEIIKRFGGTLYALEVICSDSVLPKPKKTTTLKAVTVLDDEKMITDIVSAIRALEGIKDLYVN